MSTWVLSHLHFLWLITIGVLFILATPWVRRFSEPYGRGYSVSISAVWGDFFLLLMLGATAHNIQEQGVPSLVVQDGWFHGVTIIISLIIGVRMFMTAEGEQGFVDRVHNLVVVPGFIYLMTTAFLIAFQVSLQLSILGVLVIGLWATFVVIDSREERLHQISYVRKTGEEFLPGFQLYGKIVNYKARKRPI